MKAFRLPASFLTAALLSALAIAGGVTGGEQLPPAPLPTHTIARMTRVPLTTGADLRSPDLHGGGALTSRVSGASGTSHADPPDASATCSRPPARGGAPTISWRISARPGSLVALFAELPSSKQVIPLGVRRATASGEVLVEAPVAESLLAALDGVVLTSVELASIASY